MRKVCEFGRFILPKCGADKKEFLSAVYKKGTQAKKYRLDVAQFGRSMVEMLGVLAIIGVLSVGGIAGYSKAMFKQKMNKTMDIISHAVNRVAELDTMKLGEEIIGVEDALKYGLFSDCDANYVNTEGEKGISCFLPLGDISFDLISTSDSSKIYGEFDINFTKQPFDSCVAFLSSGIYKNVPDDWWYPSTNISGGVLYAGATYLYGKSEWALSLGAKSEINNEDILNACEICKNADYCNIYWIIRNEL